ncbi:MAG: hypothetical protein LUC50_02245 [Ruminococcus sp.]|nr:hypothetical protein [Ruminococcus sp.]
MNLEQYFEKNVRVTSVNGVKYTGKVDVFAYAKDNDTNEDAIAITSAGLWLDESDIKSIEILEN